MTNLIFVLQIHQIIVTDILFSSGCPQNEYLRVFLFSLKDKFPNDLDFFLSVYVPSNSNASPSSKLKPDYMCIKIILREWEGKNINVFTAFSLSSSYAEKWDADYILCVKRDVFPILSILSENWLLWSISLACSPHKLLENMK